NIPWLLMILFSYALISIKFFCSINLDDYIYNEFNLATGLYAPSYINSKNYGSIDFKEDIDYILP
ncbi:MAG: hypothetical protein ACK55I_36760, partial [bacterium]